MVVGAPNIEDFAPASGSILQIKSMEDVEPVAKRMKFLADNPAAYNHTLRSISLPSMIVSVCVNNFFLKAFMFVF